MSNITLNYIKSKRDQNLSFFVPDGVKTETSLAIIEKTEILIEEIQMHHQVCQASNVLEHWAFSYASLNLLPV